MPEQQQLEALGARFDAAFSKSPVNRGEDGESIAFLLRRFLGSLKLCSSRFGALLAYYHGVREIM